MLPVLPMRPLYVEKLWGGARLAALPAKRGAAPPGGGPIGEAWEVADLAAGTSVVAAGAFAGETLHALAIRFGAALVGERAPVLDGAPRFPLLVKIIDAADDLSVQVHPDEAYACAHPGVSSKDEAWLVLEAAPGARVLHGFLPGVTPASFRRAIDEGRADALLRPVEVRPGDVLRIAPGTVHAIGRGCLLLEVQEPSDTTFRVWDYGRVDKDGRARPLHVEEALAVARFDAEGPAVIAAASVDGDPAAGEVPLVQTPRYALARLDVAGAAGLDGDRRPRVLFALAGEGLISGGGASHAVAYGGSVVVPPGVPVRVEGTLRLAVMTP